MLKYFEGEDKVFRGAETNKMEVKQTKNLGYEREKTHQIKTTIPLYRGRGFTEEVAEANCYSKEDKVYHKEQSLPSREGMDKNHLKENLPPLRVL